MSNGYLVVQQGGHGDRAVQIPAEGLLIGRGDDASLRLQNVSVSRHHARILTEGRRFFIEDLGSGNGTSVNLKPLAKDARHELGNEDSIQVGSFKLIFLAKQGRAFPSWKGKFVNQMPQYVSGVTPAASDATFGLDRATLRRMAEADHRKDNARLVEQGAQATTWEPADRELIFGKGAMVHLPGWFTARRAARITWVNGHHVIESLSWWTKTEVNGTAISEPTRLRNGTRFRVGKKLYRYDVPSADYIRKLYDDRASGDAKDSSNPQSSGGRRETFTIPKK